MNTNLCCTASLALCGLLAFSGSARAEGAAPSAGDGPRTSIDLQQAVRLALLHNPDTRSSGYAVKAAQGALTQAGVFENPSLFVNAMGTGVSPFQGPLPNQFGLTWTVPVGGKRSAGIAAARAGVDAAKASYQASRQALVFAVESAFVTVQLDASLLRFADADRDQFQQELALNTLRYKDGKIAYGDVLKLRVQALALDDAQREAQAALDGARADLGQLVGEGVLAPGFTVEGALTAPDGSAPGRPTTAEALTAEALASRPDYLAALAQQKSAEAALTLARRTPIPDIGILADYNHDFRKSDDAPDSYDLGLSIPLPLLDRNTGGVTQAEAAAAQAKLAVESLRLAIHDAAVKAIAEWHASQAQVSAYAAGVSTAKASLDISKHAYDVGQGSLLDYLDAESSYRQVESAYRSAAARAAIASHSLRFVAGKDVP